MASVELKVKPQVDVKRIPRFEWSWIAAACLLLGVSGGIRYIRDWQFFSLGKESERPPFPLAEFPENLGTWRAKEGSETSLEPEIAQIAGANDNLIRTYVDEKTGQTANVMILYGLAEVVWAHAPNVCYPSQGFDSVSPSRDRTVLISNPDSPTKALFREEHFSKAMAGLLDYRVVYHSFLYAGRWDFDVAKDWKSFRYHPGMFRVLVQRQPENSGKTDENFEALLGSIVREIDRRMAAPPEPLSTKAQEGPMAGRQTGPTH